MDFQVAPPSVCFASSVSEQIPHWYVAYTYPRHEKAVADQLSRKSVETFLPTFYKSSRWKDRRVTLDLPLFAGYVFTRISACERARVLAVPSVIRILSFRGVPAPVSDAEIDAIRLCIGRGAILEPHQFIAVGDRVRVKEGAFEGLEGIVVRYKNSCKLVVSIGLIHQSVALEIEANLLEQIRPTHIPVSAHASSGFRSVQKLGACWHP